MQLAAVPNDPAPEVLHQKPPPAMADSEPDAKTRRARRTRRAHARRDGGSAASTAAPGKVEAGAAMSQASRTPGGLACIVGARPNYMKMAPLLRAFADHPGLPHSVLIHTGQHYDVAMNERLFRDLELPSPDLNLEVGSGTHAVQTAEVMRRFEPVLDELAAGLRDRRRRRQLDARLQPRRGEEGDPVVHVEAGLRSFDRAMPEEINRVADRPARRPALHHRAHRRRQPRARGHRGDRGSSSSATS